MADDETFTCCERPVLLARLEHAHYPGRLWRSNMQKPTDDVLSQFIELKSMFAKKKAAHHHQESDGEASSAAYSTIVQQSNEGKSDDKATLANANRSSNSSLVDSKSKKFTKTSEKRPKNETSASKVSIAPIVGFKSAFTKNKAAKKDAEQCASGPVSGVSQRSPLEETPERSDSKAAVGSYGDNLFSAALPLVGSNKSVPVKNKTREKRVKIGRSIEESRVEVEDDVELANAAILQSSPTPFVGLKSLLTKKKDSEPCKIATSSALSPRSNEELPEKSDVQVQVVRPVGLKSMFAKKKTREKVAKLRADDDSSQLLQHSINSEESPEKNDDGAEFVNSDANRSSSSSLNSLKPIFIGERNFEKDGALRNSTALVSETLQRSNEELTEKMADKTLLAGPSNDESDDMKESSKPKIKKSKSSLLGAMRSLFTSKKSNAEKADGDGGLVTNKKPAQRNVSETIAAKYRINLPDRKSRASDSVPAAPRTNSSASTTASRELKKARKALGERGDKLHNVEQCTDKMASEAGNFAATARLLAQKYQK